MMKKTLVYVCQSFSETNGWGRLARCMAEEASRRGYRVFTSSADNTGVEGMSKAPPVFDVHAHIVEKIYRTLMLQIWIWRKSFSHEIVVHIFSEPQFWIILGLGKRVTSVGTLCGTYIDPKQHGSCVSQRLFRRSMNYFDHLVAISEYTRSRASEEWRSHMKVIPLGVSDELLSRPWKKIGWKEDSSFKVLSIGAVKPRKGFLELIRGFYEFVQACPEKKPVLCIAGDTGRGRSEYVELLQKTIRELGLTEQVILTGRVNDDELCGWYRWCDAFALTAIDDGGAFEGFGLVYLEANLFGKPCLGAVSTGASQAISSTSGVVVPSVKEADICRGLKDLCDHADKLDPVTWAKDHSWAKVFTFYESFYH